MSIGQNKKHYEDEWEKDIQVARELLYPSTVIEALKREPESIKRTRILQNARHEAIEHLNKYRRK